MVDQYRIVLVNLDPTQGTEINKTRPCVVISPKEMNKFSRVIVAPMTTNTNDYPFRVKIRHNNKDGSICLDQIRTIDKSRICNKFGKLSLNEVNQVKMIIKNMLVD
ncbi:type II toxin-antitoxin system PemK/MazF family toxin [Flammeovirga sp. EKP202]|uniref:type II toxin-antitoxin system PemK/MazF family toxin n=1 Tax=Flammeovirga sp. EKP202 TaxID=2770592 RepID=UPI00165EDA75|nr:type II toxin-antitoxin system PemK/MazF family toxin [Flammeovirga sp. EKP202]MBD0403260.1 type II toxin-antitoxin system PemK/MazF family toxin [Flammeovirga sp. EKP202]